MMKCGVLTTPWAAPCSALKPRRFLCLLDCRHASNSVASRPISPANLARTDGTFAPTSTQPERKNAPAACPDALQRAKRTGRRSRIPCRLQLWLPRATAFATVRRPCLPEAGLSQHRSRRSAEPQRRGLHPGGASRAACTGTTDKGAFRRIRRQPLLRRIPCPFFGCRSAQVCPRRPGT